MIFTDSDVADGFFGHFDIINIDERHWTGNNSTWSGYMTGTDCTMVCVNIANTFYVSVDDGTYVALSPVAESVTLFSGLSDTQHKVRIHSRTFTGTGDNVLGLFDLLGASPSVEFLEFLADKYFALDGTYVAANNRVLAIGDSFVPQYYSSESVAATFKADCTTLSVMTADDKVWLAIDGAFPVEYSTDTATNAGHMEWREIPLALSGEHEYMILTSDPTIGFMLDLSGVIATPESKEKLYQIGDSITYGTGVTRADVDIFKYAYSDGYSMGAKGFPGYTVANLLTVMESVFNAVDEQASAIIAIGTNDYYGTTPEASFKADYNSLLDYVLTQVTDKVYCRELTPQYVEPYSTYVREVVRGRSEENIVLIDTSYFEGITTTDSTHPDAAGFVTIAEYLLPVFNNDIERYTAHADANTWNNSNNKYKYPEGTPLTAADALQNLAGDGPVMFDGSGNPIPRTQAELVALPEMNNNKQVYGCFEEGGTGMAQYENTNTIDDDAEVKDHFSCL